ncbi:VOC family protein [Actinopolymorpha pittospori]|uniref:Glyoxalase-like domain-containing protein n=1 Tax=Actinopolymorpha pittospori TaxID=648752 RepID=A0A927N2I3_9ACTN|nr:VOC family protein [Actinopolymorpha pittospori]MBE1609103.1 hypothetical protein [Actinopolymorpha pittospori]
MANDERLTAPQFQQAAGVEHWRMLAFGASAWFDAPSQTTGAALVRRITELTDSSGRLPDVDLRASGVHVRIGASGSPGMSLADVELARAVSAAARDLDLAADPSALQCVQLAIDALDKPSVMSFWHAALGYERLGDDDLVDAMRRDPAIWFQQQDRPRPLRNRIHVDIARPHALALEAVEAVKALGGHETYDGEGYATLADAEGNEADVLPLLPGDELGDRRETADWRVLFGAMTFYPIVSPVRAAELAVVVAGLADEAGLPLLIDLRPDGVMIDTGKDQWEDERFADLARRIQARRAAWR